jgi:hypothetical protein
MPRRSPAASSICLLRLALLAPDIVEAILDRRQAMAMAMAMALKESKGSMSSVWKEQ